MKKGFAGISPQRGVPPAEARLRFKRVSEFPANPETGTVYLVGDAASPWFAGLKCPCGCGDFIQLSLLQESSSSWSVRFERNRTISLRPSIARTVGCRSHFTVYYGRVSWFRPLALPGPPPA